MGSKSPYRVHGFQAVLAPCPLGPTHKLTGASGASATLGYGAGTITITKDSYVFVGEGTAWTDAHVGMCIIVERSFADPYVVLHVQDKTHLWVDRSVHSVVGAGLHYDMGLEGGVHYLLSADKDCHYRVGDEHVFAEDGVDRFLEAKKSELIFVDGQNLRIAVVDSGGTETVNLYITKCPTQPAARRNLIENGRFEANTVGWVKGGTGTGTIARDTGVTYEGSAGSLKITQTDQANDVQAKQMLRGASLKPGVSYELRAMVYIPSANAPSEYVKIKISEYGGPTVHEDAAVLATMDEWQELSVVFEAKQATAIALYCIIATTSATDGIAYFDNVSLIEV